MFDMEPMRPGERADKFVQGIEWGFWISILWKPIGILVAFMIIENYIDSATHGGLNDFLQYAPAVIAGLAFSIFIMSINMVIGFKYWQWVASNKSTHGKRVTLFWLYIIISGFIEVIISCWFVLGVWQIPTLTLSAYAISIILMTVALHRANTGRVPDIFDTKIGHFLMTKNMRLRHTVYDHNLRADTDDVTDTIIMHQQ